MNKQYKLTVTRRCKATTDTAIIETYKLTHSELVTTLIWWAGLEWRELDIAREVESTVKKLDNGMIFNFDSPEIETERKFELIGVK